MAVGNETVQRHQKQILSPDAAVHAADKVSIRHQGGCAFLPTFYILKLLSRKSWQIPIRKRKVHDALLPILFLIRLLYFYFYPTSDFITYTNKLLQTLKLNIKQKSLLGYERAHIMYINMQL